MAVTIHGGGESEAYIWIVAKAIKKTKRNNNFFMVPPLPYQAVE
jgi:hypothetical protein